MLVRCKHHTKNQKTMNVWQVYESREPAANTSAALQRGWASGKPPCGGDVSGHGGKVLKTMPCLVYVSSWPMLEARVKKFDSEALPMRQPRKNGSDSAKES